MLIIIIGHSFSCTNYAIPELGNALWSLPYSTLWEWNNDLIVVEFFVYGESQVALYFLNEEEVSRVEVQFKDQRAITKVF